MNEENTSQEFSLKNIDETRNYHIEKIDQKKLIGKKHKKVCMTLNFTEHLLILASAFTGYVSISAFASLAAIPLSIVSSVIGLKLCISIIKNKREKHDKILLLEKAKLNTIEALISIFNRFMH